MITSNVNDKMMKTGCRNTKLRQEMELSPHVQKSGMAGPHEEDDRKQTKTMLWMFDWWVGVIDLEIYKGKYNCRGVIR